MVKRTRKRWGYPFLVTCSLVMGLSLWLHYSVSDAADSYDVVAKKLLEAARKNQSQAQGTSKKFASHASDLTEALRTVHRGPYLLFFNPGCESNLNDALVPGQMEVRGYPRLAEFVEVSKAHFGDLEKRIASLKFCPKPEEGYALIAAAYERKNSQWDIWTADFANKPKHVQTAKLPPTRAHRIKQIAIVLLVLGAVGLVSLLLPGFLDRFYIRREDTTVPQGEAELD